MNLDDLKQTWSDEMNTYSAIESNDFIQVKQQADELDKKMALAVRVEIYSCIALFIGVCLGIILVPKLNLAMQMSFSIMAFMSLYIPYRLLSSRNVSEEDDWSLRSRIDKEIAKLEKESALLNTAARWYLMPLAIAILLGSWGGYAQRTQTWVPDAGLWIYWCIVVIFGIGILFYHRRVRTRKIQPTLARLLEIREQLSR